MPAPINETVKRQVVQQWLSGEAQAKIAIDNNVGEGTVSGIVSDFKVGLDIAEFDSARELALAAKKQGLNLSDLASNFRLHNFIKSSGAALEDIESFIDNINSNTLPLEKVVEYVNQLFAVSREQSIPPNQVSSYIQQKIQEKQKIEAEIKQADAILQNKNVSIEAINKHIHLNQRLNEYGLSTHNIDELLNLILNAKEYGFEPKKIVAKLRNIKRLGNKESKLKTSCEALSKQADKYREIIPLAQLIWDLHIGKSELISFKIAVNEAAELYGFPRSTAAVYVLNNLKDYNKKGQLKRELSELSLQKYAIERFCSSHRQVINALANLRGHGIRDEQIILLNNFLESNGYKTSSYTVQTHAPPNSQFQG
jgi:hypothetical protein